MAKTNMTLRIEPELKEQASVLFNRLGLDLSTATGMFYRQALRCHGLPFDVKINNEPNDLTYAALEDAKNDNVSGPYNSVSSLIEALNA